MNSYITKTGDTFDSISFNLLGNEKYSVEIMKVNPYLIRTIIFESGVIVKIPKIDIKEESTLPPWK
ncbi:LysM domain-containing protein [Clostridium botulinum]|uniref:tail protein X n=1 Tax=Clostridium TaxID=1485 RepID=UPI000508AAFE|nr:MULTISPECIES: membrane protein [Clostridium]KFX57598.1 membrane protein [Clostridium botulinum]MBY6778048.1 LysM domain-containing protein [Clostridium botulinum]MBY6850964.1 LysM domain-containing protein [Clostridium botulinum]MBY7025213.1 LysM domain-containing protein [Clostridium botulinum]MBZ9691630.1 LysM domain-containing protein [Clostridium sp. M14]